MTRILLAGGAMLLAFPALAQTTGTTGTAAGGTTTPPATVAGSADATTMQSVAPPPAANPAIGPVQGPTTAMPTGRGMAPVDAQTGAVANSGTGGPYEPVDYPRCSRTLRDHCTQIGRRPRR
jgi:hypothetical protein